jgi:hypothetical protein
MNHLSIFREIIYDLLFMEVKYDDEVSLIASFLYKFSGHHNIKSWYTNPFRSLWSPLAEEIYENYGACRGFVI